MKSGCVCVCVCVCVTQAHVEPLKAWLTHVQWQVDRHERVQLRMGWSSSEETEVEMEEASALAQVSVLQAVRWEPHVDILLHAHTHTLSHTHTHTHTQYACALAQVLMLRAFRWATRQNPPEHTLEHT